MGHQLYCVIYSDRWQGFTKTGQPKKRLTSKRGFRVATPDDDNAWFINQRLAELADAWHSEDILPDEAVPRGNDQRPHRYGMPYWRDMFNSRQQLAHGHCVQAFHELIDEDQANGELDDVRRAAWGYIALAVDKMIGRNSNMSIWFPGREVVVHTFASHDFGMKWSYAEMAVTVRGLGLEWAIADVHECINQLVGMAGHNLQVTGQLTTDNLIAPSPIAPPTEVINGDAGDLPLDNESVDCIVFDPPYHDNVCYAELSDYFYVWLKRTAGYVFPEHFATYLAEKEQEAIASPARFRQQASKDASARQLATDDYEAKMAEIFAECRRVIKPDGIMTVMFNHKTTTAWDALTVGLIQAGFSIIRTWPVKTESESSIHIRGKAASRTTILLVCRPRQDNPLPQPWHEVEQLIAQAVQEDIRDNLSQADLKPIDLYLSAFGPALRIISEHWGTERESRNPERPSAPYQVTPTDALQVARREVSRHRAQEISRDWATSPIDPATKFYILASDATESDTLLFDEANLLARAIGVSLNKSDAALKRIVQFKGDKVTLLSARDRMAGGHIGPERSADNTLDAVHTAVALTERRNTLEAQEWLNRHIHNLQNSQFRHTLEALICTTKPGHDDYSAQRNLWQALYDVEPPQPVALQGQLPLE